MIDKRRTEQAGKARRTHPLARLLQRAAVPVLMAALMGSFIVAPASAAPPQPFTKLCTFGSAAGLCHLPRGIATSPTTGNIYVADQLNHRIDEFTAWGEFVKAWGWGVDDGSAELQVCTTESTCQIGLAGSGVGQLSIIASGVAVDSAGNIYVVDWKNLRVQKFNPAGEFLLMFGGEVDQGPHHPGNLCTAGFVEEGDSCGAGTPGTANGQFSSEWAIGNNVAIGSGDEVFVGDKNRIQVFSAAGVYQRQLPIPLSGSVGELAVDAGTDDVYMAYPNEREYESHPDVYRLDEATGALLDTLEVSKPSAIATDAFGNVYVFDQKLLVGGNPSDPNSHHTRILKFDSAGGFIEKFQEFEAPFEIRESVGLATSTTCFSGGGVGLYMASYDPSGLTSASDDYVLALGSAPDPVKCAPPEVPPSIDAQFASSVDTESATVKAQINPHYWSGPVGQTRYYVQYATTACIAGEGWNAPCVLERPDSPGAVLKGGVFDKDVTTEGIQLSGLQSGTAYRYRFVAEGDGAPGVAIVGRGGKAGEAGSDTGFRTAALPGQGQGGCPNEAYRTGASATLPDCRAYEMVSPVDKAGGDVMAPRNTSAWPARLDQAAEDGEAITYSAAHAFAGAVSAPFVNQYLARRDPTSGWQTQAISPAQEGPAFNSPLIQTDTSFKAVAPDLRYGWLLTDTEPVLGPDGVPGHPNLYRRDNLTGTYQACTDVPPRTTEALGSPPQLQGTSASQDLAIFRIRNELTDDSAPTGNTIYQLYACDFGGAPGARVHLVSILPDASASEIDNTGGSNTHNVFNIEQGRGPNLEGDVSADGSRIYWTASNVGSDAQGPGALYLRLNPTQPESGRLHGSARGSGDLIGPAVGVGKLNQFSKTIESVQLKSGAFSVGQPVSGPGIPAGTTITAVELAFGRIKISKGATETLIGSQFEGIASEVVANTTAASGAFAVGQVISGVGIPHGTTIEAIEETGAGLFKLTLSNKVTASAAGATLSATSPCVEPEKACTMEVSEGANAAFVAASHDGNRALYLEGGELHLFELSKVGGLYAGQDNALAGGRAGVMGASADLGRIYLTSQEALASGAEEGSPNLYLYQEGDLQFLAALAPQDVRAPEEGNYPTPISRYPLLHMSRVDSDGRTLTFMSSSTTLAVQSAEYDNTDQESGEAAFEVFRYSATEGQITCLSCNPTGQRPAVRQPSGVKLGIPDTIWAASRLAPRTLPLVPPRDMSADGSRIFFESPEALVQADTNGMFDVYEWEEKGEGTCGLSDPNFVVSSGGCLNLISSGKSPADSEFVHASADGSDVFIRTAASLALQDPGQIDIYDARVNGGFPQSPAPLAGCEGESCQGPATPPNDPTPASSAFQGAGNVDQVRDCPKGKVARKGRCVKKGRTRRKHKSHRREHPGKHGANHRGSAR